MKKLYEVEENLEFEFCRTYVFDHVRTEHISNGEGHIYEMRCPTDYIIINEGTVISYGIHDTYWYGDGNYKDAMEYLFKRTNLYGYKIEDMYNLRDGKYIDVLPEGWESIHRLTHTVTCGECPMKDTCDEMYSDSYCSGECEHCKYSNYGKEKCICEEE